MYVCMYAYKHISNAYSSNTFAIITWMSCAEQLHSSRGSDRIAVLEQLLRAEIFQIEL